MPMDMLAAAFIVALSIWFFAIRRSYEERHRHPPRHLGVCSEARKRA